MIDTYQYRQRARECRMLAEASTDVFVRVALTELAQEFDAAAEAAERLEQGDPDNGSNGLERAMSRTVSLGSGQASFNPSKSESGRHQTSQNAAAD